jgi:putative MATE family efflux protein
LVKLSLPVIGLNLLNVLALVVDTAMLGRTENQEAALTGLGYGTQLLFLLFVAMIGLTVGTVVFIARSWGAGNRERADYVFSQSVQLCYGLGVVTAIGGNLLAVPLLKMLGAEGDAMDAALLYLRPMLLLQVFNYLNVLMGAALRGAGNTLIPFLVAVVMNLINAGLNYGLILGNYGLPAMGIQGAAIGTVVAQGCAVLMMVAVFKAGLGPGLSLSLLPRKPDWPLIKDLVRVGAPAGADMLVLNAAFLSIVGMLGRIDPLAVAAHGIGLRIQALAFVPGMSISQATGALVGQALGAGNVERAKKVVRASVFLCVGVMGTLGLIIIFFRAPLVGMFEVDPNVGIGPYATMWMQLLGFCMPVVGVYIALVGMLQGSGKTRVSLGINALVTLALQIPASFILGFPLAMGAFGIWLAFPLGFVLKTILASAYWRKGTWAQVGERV